MKFKKPIIAVLIILVVLISLYILWLIVAVHIKTSSSKETKKTLSAQVHKCDKGTEEQIEPWGFGGWSRFCLREGKKHGKWVAWERNHLNIEGWYNDGLKHGKWIWYDSNSQKTKVIYYSNGKEVRSTGTKKSE